MNNIVVTFGEIMARLTAPNHQKIRQACPGSLNLAFGGAEANVAASISQLGGRARFVTALPRNALGDACIGYLRGLGVDTEFIVQAEDSRLGLYFVETGANQRPSSVIYDRKNSAINQVPASDYEWAAVFKNAAWLHVSGITAALSDGAAESLATAIRAAKEAGVKICLDLNFRRKLWVGKSESDPAELADQAISEILPDCDVVIGILNRYAARLPAITSPLDKTPYLEVARQMARDFPNLQKVVITLRENISASHNNWGAMLYEVAGGRAYFAPEIQGNYSPYVMSNMVDRIGGGDSFAAGLIYAMTQPDLSSPDKLIEFAVASACLAHSIPGDVNYSTRQDVEALIQGGTSGKVVR